MRPFMGPRSSSFERLKQVCMFRRAGCGLRRCKDPRPPILARSYRAAGDAVAQGQGGRPLVAANIIQVSAGDPSSLRVIHSHSFGERQRGKEGL
eukprot:13447910-Alexandrium_andersonii.AAC.1